VLGPRVHRQHQLGAFIVRITKILRKMTTTTAMGVTGRSTRSRSRVSWSRRRLRSGRHPRSSCDEVVAWRPCHQCPRPPFEMKVTNVVWHGEHEKGVSHGASEALTRLRRRVNRDIRNAVGLSKEPPPRCNDPDEAYFASTAWRALFTATCRPCWSAGSDRCSFRCSIPHHGGVAQHSRSAKTPSGDSSRRPNFIGFTTYGTSPRPTRRLNGPRVHKSFVVSRRRVPTSRTIRTSWRGSTRRDLDVPHGLPTLRRGAIERRRRRSLRARNGEPGSRPGMVDPQHRWRHWRPPSSDSGPNCVSVPTAPRRVTSSCTVSSADRSSVRSTGCSFAVRSPS